MVGGSLWVGWGLCPGAARLRRWVSVVWARVEPRHLGDLQNRPGNPRRNPARDHDVDLVADRAAGTVWYRYGSVWVRGCVRPSGWAGAGRLSGRVRELAADLLH